LFNDTLSRFFDDGELGTRTWAPAVDIYETDHDVVLKAELPGVDPKDVEIRVEDGTLYLKGQRKFEIEVKEENYHRVERSYGSFTRSFALPSSVNSEKAKAEYKDGLLTLTLPKREEAKPKTIQINVSKN
jgi:HSP20 family protein